MGTAADHRLPDVADLASPLLEVAGLRTTFATPRGTVHAVEDVSFSLDRGRTLGVVGESGSGKTVLVRSIMGLLPSTTATRTGTVRFAGATSPHWPRRLSATCGAPRWPWSSRTP